MAFSRQLLQSPVIARGRGEAAEIMVQGGTARGSLDGLHLQRFAPV
jgi:hypothetical protein